MAEDLGSLLADQLLRITFRVVEVNSRSDYFALTEGSTRRHSQKTQTIETSTCQRKFG